MLYVPRFRAALLTLLVFATSLSVSVCDLSCSFPSACSHCCGARLDMPGQANMVMSSDMPMSGTSTSGMKMSGMKMSGSSAYGNDMARESNDSVRMQHSISSSTCASEACRQAWDSSSPRTPQLLPLDAANIRASIDGNLLAGLPRSPKEIIASQSLALAPFISPLRI